MKKLGGRLYFPTPGGEVSSSQSLPLNDAIRIVVQDTLPEGQLRSQIESISQDPEVQRVIYESRAMQNVAFPLALFGGLAAGTDEDHKEDRGFKELESPQPPIIEEVSTDQSPETYDGLEVLLEKPLPLPDLPRHSCDKLGSKRLARFQATTPAPNTPEYCKTEELDPNELASTSGHAGMPGLGGAIDETASASIPGVSTKYMSYVVTSVLFLAAVYMSCGDIVYQQALSAIVLDPAFRYCAKKIYE